MPARKLIAEKVTQSIAVLSHPDRFRIVQELSNTEKNVQLLTAALDLPQSTVSQHLSILRAQHLVKRRRESRQVFYSLADPWIAQWLLEGLRFLEISDRSSPELLNSARKVRQVWQPHFNG